MKQGPIKSPYFKATEEVVLILERSKKSSDDFIDRLPGIYLVADHTGAIYRTNNSFKDLSDSKNTQTQLLNIFEFVSDEQKEFFKNKIALAFDNPLQTYYFELQMNFLGQDMKFSLGLYSWFVKQASNGVQLFSIVGTDVSELERAAIDNKRMKKEIQSAEQLQALVLPQNQWKQGPLNLYCYYQAAAECGGDFLYHNTADGRLRIWAGDVTGHGVGPAMVTGVVKGAISVLEKQPGLDILSKMHHLNQCVLDFAKEQYLMTFQIVEIDLNTHEMEFCQAGHTELFEFLPNDYDSSKSIWSVVNTLNLNPSTPLGTANEPQFNVEKYKIKKGAYYACFSDGFEEAENSSGKAFGQRRLFESYLKTLKVSKDLVLACDKLLEDLQHFSEFRPLDDDISFWSLHTNG